MNLKKLLFILIKLLLTPIKVLFYLNSILIQLTTNYYIRRTFILNESEYKIQLIKNIAKFYNYESFIETGTYLGGTSYGVRKIFKSILTTELNKLNFNQAKIKLNKFQNIKIYNMDSELFLKDIIPVLKIKSIFFLDAHYSGKKTSKSLDNLCYKEISEILKSKIKNHLIIIDDISDFSPKTFGLHKILFKLEKINKNYKFYFEYDMLFAIPNETSHREFFKKIIPSFIVR